MPPAKNQPSNPFPLSENEVHSLTKKQHAFFKRMGDQQQFQALFEHLPDVHFFAKDKEGKFIAGSAGLLQRLGYSHEYEIIGKTDDDFHPPRTAKEIREDDERVMTTREPLVDRVEALFTRSQAKDWYVTTKLPILDRKGDVIGVMGFVRPYRKNENIHPGDERLERVVAYIQEHHASSIPMNDLARLAAISVRQLHRLFHDVFGMSTETFIVRTRVQAASDDLLMTDKPLSAVAIDHGFCDQSAFTRRFAEHTGETPLRFRQRRKRGSGPNPALCP